MSVSKTSTYAGQFAGKYIAASLLTAKTIDDGAITVLPNIKYKAAMKVGAFSNLIKNASCDFDTSTSSLTLTEKVLTPKELQVNIDICKKDLHSDWEAAQMGFSAFDELPPLFSDFVIARVAAEVASATESNIWSGADTDGNFEGFKAKLAADSTVVDVTATDITSANVVAQIGAVVDAIPAGVYGADDLYISAALFPLTDDSVEKPENPVNEEDLKEYDEEYDDTPYYLKDLYKKEEKEMEPEKFKAFLIA